MWIVCITSVRHVLTVNGYGGRQTKENEKSWCFKGWETLVNNDIVTVVFNCDAPTASITITDASGVNVYSGTSINPTLITIELNATEPGEYYLEIELGEARLSGYFTL